MTIQEILTEARTGNVMNLLCSLKVKDSSKMVANSSGEMTFATTMFCKKHVNRNIGDEIVQTGSQETPRRGFPLDP